METFEMWDSRQCKEDTLLISFPSSEVVLPPLKILNAGKKKKKKKN
jgi:hypothetical protein